MAFSLPTFSPSQPPTAPTIHNSYGGNPYGVASLGLYVGVSFAVALVAVFCCWAYCKQRGAVPEVFQRVPRAVEAPRQPRILRVLGAQNDVVTASVVSGVPGASSLVPTAHAVVVEPDTEVEVPTAPAFLLGITTKLLPAQLADALVTEAGIPPSDAQKLIDAGIDSHELRLTCDEARLRRLGITNADSLARIRSWIEEETRPLESALDGTIR